MMITEYRKTLKPMAANKDGKFYEFSIDWLGNKDFLRCH